MKHADLDWIIVRPAALTNGPGTGKYRHGARVGNYILPRKVSRADVAEFMLHQVNDDTYVSGTPGICD